MNVYDVNWLAVVLAALSGFVVGGIWYGPIIGKRWMGAVGLTEEDIKKGNMGVTYGMAFVFSLISSAFLAHMFERLGGPPFHVVMMISVGIAIGFVIPAIGTNYLFSQKSRELFFIDAGYWLLFYAAMGGVHGYFYAV